MCLGIFDRFKGIETFTIVGNNLFGQAIQLYPEPHLRRFNYYFNPDGSMRTMDVLFSDLQNTSLPLQTKSGFLPYRITMKAGHELLDFRFIDAAGEKQFTWTSHRMDFFGGWIPIIGQWQWLTDLLIAGKLVLGDPSPHEKFETEVGGARIIMDYGRPSKRGRVIFGSVVPYHEIWRTGAGAPTMFTTDKGLEFNGTLIPAGRYNIFTMPAEDHWTLVFNTEEETWGSAYDSGFDFARVPMDLSNTKDVIEKFTIEIVPSKKGGTLQMMWDQTLAQVVFTVVE